MNLQMLNAYTYLKGTGDVESKREKSVIEVEKSLSFQFLVVERKKKIACAECLPVF